MDSKELVVSEFTSVLGRYVKVDHLPNVLGKFLKIVEIESNFKPSALSRSGNHLGLTQCSVDHIYDFAKQPNSFCNFYVKDSSFMKSLSGARKWSDQRKRQFLESLRRELERGDISRKNLFSPAGQCHYLLDLYLLSDGTIEDMYLRHVLPAAHNAKNRIMRNKSLSEVVKKKRLLRVFFRYKHLINNQSKSARALLRRSLWISI